MEPGQKTGTGETWSKGHTKDPVSGILDDQDQHSSSKARIMVLQRPVGVPNSAWHPGSLGGGVQQGQSWGSWEVWVFFTKLFIAHISRHLKNSELFSDLL